jgi:hypothetical protein
MLHVPKHFVNLLKHFVYQIAHTCTEKRKKRVEFTPNFMTIYDMHDNSNIVIGEVNYQSHLYTFFEFIAKYEPTLLLTHVDDDSGL